MGLLDLLFGKKNKMLKEALASGASIVDVRTAGEFAQGSVEGSVNIPLDKISKKADKIKKMQTPILLCCASGMRSGTAVSILKNKGLSDIHNAGSWMKLYRMKQP